MAESGGAEVGSEQYDDISKDVSHLICQLDTIYELHTFLPQNIDKDLCVTFLRSGVCSSKCSFHHPVMSRPSNDPPSSPIHDLIYLFERTASMLDVVTYEAAQDIAGVIKRICSIMSSNYEIYFLKYDHGDVSYLYDVCSRRVLLAMGSFVNKRNQPQRYFKKTYHVKPPINSLLEICMTELRVLIEKFQADEDSFYGNMLSIISTSPVQETLTCDMLAHAETVHSLHEFTKAKVALLTDKVKEMLHKLWDTSQSPTSFEIVHSDLSAVGLCITPHLLPVELIISRDSTSHGATHQQALEEISIALSSYGFVVEGRQNNNSVSFLLVTEKNQSQGHPTQPIHIYLDNRLAVLNTGLFNSYVSCHSLVKPLVLAVQQWARVRGCSNSENSTLSMYGWTVLVVFFLQSTSLISIPSLEQIGNMWRSSSQIQQEASHEIPLGSLLLNFFLFYGTGSSSGFQVYHSIATLRNKQKMFKRESYFSTKSSNVAALCMSSQDAVCAICPEKNMLDQPSVPIGSKKGTGYDNHVEEENDNTDREVSSNTSYQSRNGRQQILVLSKSVPLWRFCIEHPLDDVDLGSVIYSRTGQAHLLNEIRRALTLHSEISREETTGNERRNYWNELCVPNSTIPQAVKTCSVCGQHGHADQRCELLRCHLCNEIGHFVRDCLRNFCSNCRKQGHFAKECPLPKTCRVCKQPGHILKDCPLKNVCAKCGSDKHVAIRCPQSNTSIGKNKSISRKTRRSDEIAASVDVPEILSVGRDRFDSFDAADEESIDAPANISSRGYRRKNRHAHHRVPSNLLLNKTDKKDSKPLPREKKVSVPTLSLGDISRNRMPWNSKSNSLRPSLNVKHNFIGSMYSPQSSPFNSPFSSPRGSPTVAQGKMHYGKKAMQKSSHYYNVSSEAKPSNMRPPSSNCNTTSYQGRPRGGSMSSITAAGYTSSGYATPSPRVATSPIRKSVTMKADSKVDSLVHSKSLSKPQSMLLQKKASGAKVEPQRHSYIFPGSPTQRRRDSKVMQPGVTEYRQFTSPYPYGVQSHSSPDSHSPGMKEGAEIRSERKREKKRSSRLRKKQAKREKGAKNNNYIDECNEGVTVDGRMYIEERTEDKFALITGQSFVSEKPSWPAVTSSDMYDEVVAEEKNERLTVDCADFLEYT